MRLKKIEIFGFKSFADRTVLKFDLGLTAIVGPNGCGKSNVADAFRWVLGEQSARSLRGNKMNDVIFAGTSHRKPQNYAEVTITLSEVEGKLPVAYDEVSVTRRLYRSGESEYFINKQPVRLKDIQDLLLDSGIGNDAYAIFEQGKIDEVIKLPPLERRYIFEEAAGIKRFLQRKKESMRKLEQTKGNIDRVRDLHQEIERQVVILEKQAEEAKEYKEKKAELDSLEKTFLAEKWFEWEQKKKAQQEKIEGTEASIAESTGKWEGLQGEIAQVRTLLAEAETALRNHSEAVFRSSAAKEIHGKERENCLVRIDELQQKEVRWTKDLDVLKQRRIEWGNEKKNIAAIVKSLEAQQTSSEKDQEKQYQQVHNSEENLKKQKEDLQKKQKSLMEAMHALQIAKGDLKQLEIRIENAHEREKYLHIRSQQLDEQRKIVDTQSEESKTTFDSLLSGIEEKKGLLASLEIQLTDTVSQLDNIENQQEKLLKDLMDAKARYKAIKSLQEDMEGFSAGTQQLLKESSLTASPIHKKVRPLYPYFTAKKGAEKAIAAVMAIYGQTLVVDTLDDFYSVVEFAKKKGVVDFSIVCLEHIAQRSKKNSSKKDASFLIVYVDENDIVQHFLSQIILPKQDVASHYVEGPCVRFDGVFTDENAVTFFPKNEGVSVFLRESEIKELDKSIVSMEKERGRLEQVISSVRQKRKELQAEIITIDKAIRQLEIRSAEVNVSLQKYGVDRDRLQTERNKVAEEVTATTEALKQLTQGQLAANDRVASTQKESTSIQKEVDAAVAKFETLTLEANQHAQMMKKVQNSRQELFNEKQKQLNALNIIEAKEVESQQQEKRIVDELEAGKSLHVELLQQKTQLEATLKNDDKALVEAVKTKASSEEVVAKRHKEIASIQAKADAIAKDLKKLQDQLHQIQVHIAQTDIQIQTVSQELLEKYSLDANALAELPRPDEKSVAKLESRVKRLRHELEGATTINMTSIEEYEKCQVRHKDIAVQLTDMAVAEKELLAIIAELDNESRELFKITFAKIRENFQKNFAILFTGGEADLQFVDSTDILEAGIEIVAKPPGKQMRSISLLSGGEKCLTALALLFAIFEVKPSPFCILDEIDAPLDDSNVDRFVNIVKEFSEICQFIVITHNKRTMSIADRIFGVSMEEKGISKLLTIDLATQKAPEMVTA